MLSAYVTELPSSSVLPAGATIFATVDGRAVAFVLACVAAMLATVIVARRNHRDVDARRPVTKLDRDTPPRPRKLSAA
jgi:hypothetical protein